MNFRLLILLCFFTTSLSAQITLLNAPADYQLYPRNANNTSEVVFLFTSAQSGTVKLQVRENGVLIKEISKSFLPKDTVSISATIEAKPSEYSFTLQVGQQTIERKNIVCGDFLVLYGQSNIKALSGIDDFQVDTRLLRNYDTKHPSEPNVWSTAELPYASTGIIGLQLQSLILEKYGIPTCIINGSRGGASIYSLLDGGEYYQTLMKRVEGAGAKGHIKAIIWRQGEAETCNWYKDIEDYPMHFTQLMSQIDRDFPEIHKFYNIQTGILHCNQMEDAGKLREYMRKTRYLFPKVETTNMHLLPLSDDVHYTKDAYIQTARELLPLLGRDLYKDQDYPEIRPPDIQNVYRNATGDTLVLEFEKGQNIHFPEPISKDGFVWKMEDYFYVNTITQAQHDLVHSGWAKENKVYLKLNWNIYEGYVTYLPSYAQSSPPRQEIQLKNSKGLRAMSFYQFPVKIMLSTPKIREILLVSKDQIRINFGEKGNYSIERKGENEQAFFTVGSVKDSDHYVDQADFTQKVAYRILRTSEESSSDYSETQWYDFRAEVSHTVPNLVSQNHKETIALLGKNFGQEKGKVEVLNQPLTIHSWENDKILVSLPTQVPPGDLEFTIVTAHGQTVSIKLRVDALLSAAGEQAAVAYPQPLIEGHILQVKGKENINKAVAFDALGKSIALPLKEKLPGEYQVDTGILPAGIYILQLTGKNVREAVRFHKL
jgi:hypothetical protein